jgi:hypothetical protein
VWEQIWPHEAVQSRNAVFFERQQLDPLRRELVFGLFPPVQPKGWLRIRADSPQAKRARP